MLNVEKLNSIIDDVNWISESLKNLDLTNEDDVNLYNSYTKKLEEHQEYLNNVKKELGID